MLKHGAIHHLRIDLKDAPLATEVRKLQLATQTEGCVVDPRSRKLYVGEEARGVWAFDARANGPIDGQLIAAVDNAQLVADVEGLAIMPTGRQGGWLVGRPRPRRVPATPEPILETDLGAYTVGLLT